MPLSLDTFLVQAAATGSFNAASGAATLGSGTTAGNTVLIFCATRAAAMNTPSGFVAVDTPVSQGGTTKVYQFRRSNVPASETSWTLTPSGSSLNVWVVMEADRFDPDAPLDVVPSSTISTASGTSVASGTTPQSTTYDGVAFALHAAWDAASTVPTTFSGHTNGFTELAEVGGDNGTGSLGLSVSALATQTLGAQTTTATSSKTLTATNTAGSTICVLSAQGAKREANIQFLWGFKVGAAAAGLGTGNAGSRYIETIVGSPTMTTDGLQLASTTAAENVATATLAALPSPQAPAAVRQLRFRFDGSLPSVDVDLFTRAASSTEFLVLRYRTASAKLGVQIASGTEQLSDTTVTADTWITVDWRMYAPNGTSTSRTVNWQVDYGAGPVPQTTLSHTATGGSIGDVDKLGWSTAITVPGVTFAHYLCSNVAGHYPLGPYTMVLLKADTGATPTVSGTVGNFAFITSNATGAALTSGTLANVPATIDDFPPTVGGSADGFCAVTASASDYLEVPLETYDAATNGARVQAARVVIPMWAASATAATCRVLGYDGSTAATLFSEADPEADNSSTPAWVCRMWRPTNGWTQAKLDAAAVRFGSNDATPDIGPHAVGMEIAVKDGDTLATFGTSGDVLVDARVDPVSGGVIALDVTTPVGRPADLTYEVSGSPSTLSVAGGDTDGVVLDAPDAPTVGYVKIETQP